MAIRKFRTGQQTYDVSTYVGTYGTIFYDEANGALRISDGVTPGGNPIGYPLASATEIGGVKLGPGVILNSEGQIIIDSTGLDFSFGDIESITEQYEDSTSYSVLRTINANEDLYLASNGTGSINVIGEFNVYKTDGTVAGAIAINPIFTVKADGQVQMLVPGADSNEGAVTIVGGLDGVFQAPVLPGVMLHVTGIGGAPGVPSRIYNDAQNAFGSFVTRRYNGTALVPTAVLADEEIMRISGTAHNGTLIPGTANQRILFRALGNQTLTNAGGAIELWATPLNSTTLAKIATVNSAGITLESGKVLTGNVTGNATTVSNGVYTTDTGTVTNTMLAGSIANNKLANSSITVNGTSIALGGSGTVTAAAGTLTGTTLAANVVSSSLTSVGTLTSLSVADGISDGIGNVRSLPINSQTGAYNLAATDNGKMISITTGGVSVLQNVFASPYGQIISIYNDSNSNQTITQGAGVTLRLSGTAATGNRTLARYGVATITCVAANTFVISGAGLT